MAATARRALRTAMLVLALAAAAAALPPPPPPPPPPPEASPAPSPSSSSSSSAAQQRPPSSTPAAASASGLLGLRLPALQRALFVLAALAGLALFYYVGGRALRARKSPRKKYGLLSNSEDNLEMASLESDEDTVFEMRHLRR